MSPANNTQVLIGGNVYTLSGNESEEYIQRVALYINNKLDEIMASDNAKQLNTRLISVLLDINIADDYFKALEKIEILENKEASHDHVIDELKTAHNDKIDGINKELSQALQEQGRLNAVIEDLEKELDSYKRELDEYIEIFDQNNAN